MNSSFQPRPWSDTEVDGPLAAPLSPVRASGSRIVSMAALIAGDVVAVALVVELVRLVVTGSETTSNAIRLLVFACAVQIVIKAALGAYPGLGLYHEARLRKGAGAWLGACLVAIAAALFLPVGGVMPLVTLCFSLNQALLAAKAGATYISPFVGRLDDISHDGMALIEQITEIYTNYDFDTEVLVASIRSPMHVLEAARLGADVVTVPMKVIRQLVKHPLTDIGLAKFLADWEKVPK